ncbi:MULTISPECIES: YbgF trimerization domain-containing protein [Acinetobacter]|uniref:YbgF trimerization domain-containing protein n=1 Tax=Acinetobacter TaxID=469 RepID=UPI0014439941|nr:MULTISPECIES: YbgF trimerization domain-containing protein [Acinetobacter]
MMLKKHTLCALTLLCSAPALANIPIESRGLSQNSGSASTPTAIGASNSGAPVTTNLNWQLMQKNQQLENDIRTLRGKMEEQENEIAQLKHELTNRYTDLDQRLELLNQKIDPEAAPAVEEDNQQDSSPSTASSSQPTSNPVNNTAAPAPAATTVVSTQSSTEELEKAAYTIALDAYKQGGAKKAIAPMQNFIKNHPNSVYISNAYFWLAEFNLAIEPTNYSEAKKNFEIVASKYPNSSKASNAVYRLYSIAKNVDKNDALAAQYRSTLLTKYPSSQEAGFVKSS